MKLSNKFGDHALAASGIMGATLIALTLLLSSCAVLRLPPHPKCYTTADDKYEICEDRPDYFHVVDKQTGDWEAGPKSMLSLEVKQSMEGSPIVVRR